MGKYNYHKINNFEIRYGVKKDYNYNDNHTFEIRIINNDSNQMEILLEKIKEWLK